MPVCRLLALSLALAGFGSWAKPVSAQTLPTVTIGKAVDTIPFTVVDVAIAEGYFKQNGVDVKEELVQGSSAANAAMVGGSLQFACEAAVPLMLARSHGVPIMAVDALDDGVTLQLLVSNKWLSEHPIAADATFEQKMADLNGSIFAEVGTTEQAFYGLLRGWAGLPKLDGYRLVQIELAGRHRRRHSEGHRRRHAQVAAEFHGAYGAGIRQEFRRP